MICVSMGFIWHFFGILLGAPWVYWVCGFVSDINFEEFSVIIASDIYSVPLFLFLLVAPLCICYIFCVTLYYTKTAFPLLLDILFCFFTLFSLCFSILEISIVISSCSEILWDIFSFASRLLMSLSKAFSCL